MEKEGLIVESELKSKDETGYSEQEMDIKIEQGIFTKTTDPANQPKTIFEKKSKNSK